MRKVVVASLVFIAMSAAGVNAQTTTGRLIGTIQDDHGAILVGVAVTIESAGPDRWPPEQDDRHVG